MPLTVSGLSIMLTKLEGLAEPRVIENAARQAVREGSNVLREAVVEQAPVRVDGRSPNGNALEPGMLKEDIDILPTRPRPGVIGDTVTPGSKTRHVALWVEEGHDIVTGGKLRRSKKDGRILANSKGRVVGRTEPNQFLLRAFEMSREDVVSTVRESVRSRVKELSDK